jgi:hypothetical protein
MGVLKVAFEPHFDQYGAPPFRQHESVYVCEKAPHVCRTVNARSDGVQIGVLTLSSEVIIHVVWLRSSNGVVTHVVYALLSKGWVA